VSPAWPAGRAQDRLAAGFSGPINPVAAYAGADRRIFPTDAKETIDRSKNF
jgi:hypothetical protein